MTDRQFMSMPVVGDITRGGTQVEQWPVEKLTPLFQAVLDDPGVGTFGWDQSTPYFNDGDPCVFGASALWAVPAGEPDEDEDDPCGFKEKHAPEYGYYADAPWGHRNWRDGDKYEGPDEARYDRLTALSGAITGGHFDNVLLETFGDHAEITCKDGKFSVEFYDHD